MPQRRRSLLILGVVSFLIASLTFGSYHSNSICPTCHRMQSRTEFQVPLVGLPLFWWTSEQETPVEKWLAIHRPVSPHKHDWWFAQGMGNGVMCALGPGRMARDLSNREAAVNLLEAVRLYDSERLDEFIRLARCDDPSLDPHHVCFNFMLHEVSADAYRDWQEFHYPMIYEK